LRREQKNHECEKFSFFLEEISGEFDITVFDWMCMKARAERERETKKIVFEKMYLKMMFS